MVSASVRRLRLATAVAVLYACHPDAPFVVRTDIPVVCLVLAPDSLVSALPELRALVANTGTPVSVEYLTADQFEMRRSSDGASFDWYAVPPVRIGAGLGGNYALAETASAAGLGRADLAAGETYTLEIALGDRVITGETTIPDHPRPRVVLLTDGSRMLVWPRVAAAAAYDLEISSDVEHTQTTVDTFYLLHDDFFPDEAGSRIVVTAMDSNWVRYRNDSTATSAGLDGAYGVFGATSTTTLILPPKSAP